MPLDVVTVRSVCRAHCSLGFRTVVLLTLWIVASVASVAIVGCGSRLPEAGTAAADLYVKRCSTCHPPYNPALLTAKMWEAMVQRMEGEMRRRGVMLAPEDKAAIIDYLSRNAGQS